MTQTRRELMQDFDRQDDAVRHRVYISALRAQRDIAFAAPAIGTPHRLARDAVVSAIDKLIHEAERREA